MDTNLGNTARVNDVLWVGTYDDGAFRSSNLGQSYDKKFSGHVLSLVLNNFNPANTGDDGDVFLGTDNDGIKYSADGGGTWSDISYNLATDADRIIRSIIVMKNGAPDPNRDRVFVGTHGHGVWYLDYDSGGPASLTSSWVEANGNMFSGVPNNESLQRSVVHALVLDSHGDLYAGTNDGLYISSDSGAHWRLVLDGIVNSWDSPVIVRSLEVYVCNNVEYIMAGTDGSYVWRARTNASMSSVNVDWTQYTGLAPVNNTASGLQSATVLDLLFTDIDGKFYAGTMDKGVHRSDDCGEIWEQKSNLSLQDGYRVIQSLVFNSDGNRLYGGTFGFGVIMSNDINGVSPILYWTRTNNGILNSWVYSMALNRVGSTDYLFAGTWNGGVFRSTDDGETWQFSGLANRIVYDIDINADGVIFAATDRGEVSRSIDNGLTWQEIGVANTAIWSLGIDPWDPNNIYAGTFGGGVYVSGDGGFTWTQTKLTSGHIFDFTFGPHPEHPGENGWANALFAATATGVVYTLDGGITWDTFEENHGLTVVDTRAIAFAGNTLLAGTWGGGVFLYDEGSDSWIRDGLPGGQITTFAVNPITEEVFVTNEGNGIYRKQYPVTASIVANEDPSGDEIPTAFELGQNYPNPFNPSTQIEFSLPETGEVHIAVYDALGRQVRALVDGTLSSGSHLVTFEAADLPSGVYFYRLETAQQSLTKSMILMK